MDKRILSLLMVAVLAILALVPAVLAEEEGFDPGYNFNRLMQTVNFSSAVHLVFSFGYSKNL